MPPTASPRPSEPGGTAPLALLLAVGATSFLDSSAIIAVGLGLAPWRDDLGLGVWDVGAVSASLTCSIAFGALVGGRAADLLGRGRTFTWSLVVYAAGAGLVAAAGSTPTLVAGVVVLGAASGADLPASLATLADHAPTAVLGRLTASTHVLWTAGVLVTSTAGLAVSTRGADGIRLLFAALAVLALAVALLRAAQPRLREPVPGGPRAPARPTTLRVLLRDHALVAVLALMGTYYVLYTLVASTFGSFRAYVLVTVGGASQTTTTAVLAATGLVGLGATVVFAMLADSAWRGRLFPAAMATYAVALALVALSGGTALPVVVLALVLQNLAFPFVGDALVKVWMQESFAAEVRASAQGVVIAAARACAAAFALVTPALLAWSPASLFAGLLVVVGAASVVGLRLRARSEHHRTAGRVAGS